MEFFAVLTLFEFEVMLNKLPKFELTLRRGLVFKGPPPTIPIVFAKRLV